MKFPFRRQLEAMDCGPACIQMIAAYYGKNVPLSYIKKLMNMTRLGVSASDIVNGCENLGLESCVARVKKHELENMPLPAILYWRQEHYIVLYDRRENRKGGDCWYYIADPSFGKAKLSESEFLKNWMGDLEYGITCLLEPTEKFFQLDDTILSRKKSVKIALEPFRLLRNYRSSLLGAFFFSIITFVCSWLIPFILQYVIDEGIGNKDFSTVLLLLFAQLGLHIGYLISNFVNNHILYKTGLNVGLGISSSYIYKLVRLPIHFFDTRIGTDLLQRLNDESKIEEFLTYTFNNTVIIILNIIVYSTVLLYYDLYIFIVFAIFAILLFLLAKATLKARKFLNYSLFTYNSDKRNLEYELVNGMMEIKTNTANAFFLDKWKGIQLKINTLFLKNLHIEYFLNSGSTFLNVLRDIIITGTCAYLVIHQELTLGIMMTITYILGNLSGTISQMTIFIKSFQDSQIAYERIDDVQKLPEEDLNKKIRLAESTEFADGFVLENLSFKYAGSYSPFVLNEINARIPLHQVTAIVGPSGSRKTTLLKLLLAFYCPQKGDLYLNGMKTADIHSEDWHKHCGVVMQDGLIFSDTISRNIALSDDKPDIEKLRTAARIACIDEFIDSLPMKYNTKIGNTGLYLSGGQKQRILIARAVYRNPEFVFFDEATSSLDANNEMQIMNNLKSFYEGRTVVIIAHRLSTVKDADNILVLDKGRLVEQGNHHELSEQRGMYYHLIKNQLELGI